MKIVALTGAGISKSAGIPTYEDLNGIKDELTVELKENEPERFAKAYSLLVNNVKDKEPTKAHRILAKLNIPIITMNVDTLHTKAGSKDVIELHGNYIDKNIVLYGQEMLRPMDAITLIMKTAKEAKENNEEAGLLVIGTSMQTAFAHTLVWLAKEKGMEVLYIDHDADSEVERFFQLLGMLDFDMV